MLSSVITQICNELGFAPPVQSYPYNIETTARQLMYVIRDEVESLKSQYTWPQLRKECLITLVAGQDSYALPADFDRALFRTHWDRANKWELAGPLTAEEWQAYKSGIVSTGFPRKRFRVMSNTLKQFFIDPVPSASEAGHIIAFEYQSSQAVVPTTWQANKYLSDSYHCFYNGNIYQTTQLDLTTGATPPTHTVGTVSDGALLWTYISSYEYFGSGGDEFLLDERIVKLGAKWKFMESKGLEFSTIKDQYDAALKREMFHLNGAATVNLAASSPGNLLTFQNTPDTGYGS